MTILTHYDKFKNFFQKHEEITRGLWNIAVERTDSQIPAGTTPGARFLFIFKFFTEICRMALENPSLSKNDRDYLVSLIMMFPIDVIYEEACKDEEDFSSFSYLMSSEQSTFMIREIMSTVNKCEDKSRIEVEMSWMLTSFIVRFHMLALKKFGMKVYEISPDLQWALMPENTNLKGVMSDMIRLPFPCVYICLPRMFKVINEMSGWHETMGVYITEDTAREPRCWRIVIAAEGNDNTIPYDDAIYHYSVSLKEGATIEECLEDMDEVAIGSKVQSFKIKGKEIQLDNDRGEDYLGYFLRMKDEIHRIFKYIMNVILYATSTEADLTFQHVSEEYRKLKDRAMKSQGTKRKELFSRLRERKDGQTRMVLGRSFTIDRKKSQESGECGEGGKHKVRYMVSGHWRQQPHGEGRKLRRPIWIKPHWRGPEAAPITETLRKLV